MGDIKRITALSDAYERGFAVGRDDLQQATLGSGEGELAIPWVGLDGEGNECSGWLAGGGYYDGVYYPGREGGAVEGVQHGVGADGGVAFHRK